MAVTEAQRIRARRVYARILNLQEAGAQMVIATQAAPMATAGIFTGGFPAWEPNKQYAENEVFSYNGQTGFARQALTSSAVYPPFSTGTEALYGVRPAPDADNVYPYMYNMAVTPGMRVRYGEDIYKCIQAANPLLYSPDQVPALFEKETVAVE